MDNEQTSQSKTWLQRYSWFFLTIAIIAFVLFLGAQLTNAAFNYRIPGKAKEAEVKQNLHAIQIALERYAIDSPGGTYPLFISGGDWTDSYVVWMEWVDAQENISVVDIVNETRRAEWMPAPNDMGDTLVMEAYMPSYPSNPFMKSKSDTVLPRIPHHPEPRYGSLLERIVGGRESTKMYEVFGAVHLRPSQGLTGDLYVHHIYNNPPYSTFVDLYKEPVNGWKNPSGNAVLVGNFSYYPRRVAGEEWPMLGADLTADPSIQLMATGYTLAGYGAMHTKGQDVYNRNGNYQGRFRTEPCELDLSDSPLFDNDIPCVTGSAAPSREANDGGSDTIPDGVIITLDSGVDKKMYKGGSS